MDARDLLERVSEVCPLPASTQRVLALVDDPNASYQRIGNAVAADPALAAEVMRIARSPSFATREKVEDLPGAIRLIGLGELREMASAMAMLAAFRSEEELALRIHDHALSAGMLARELAIVLGHRRPGTVYLAGLLCEIGALACLAVDAEAYVLLRFEAGDDYDRRAALERSRYGRPSWELGAAFLERNRLPEEVCAAVGTLPDAEDVVAVAVTYFVRRALPLLTARGGRDDTWIDEVHAIAQSVGLDLSAERLGLVLMTASTEAMIASASSRL